VDNVPVDTSGSSNFGPALNPENGLNQTLNGGANIIDINSYRELFSKELNFIKSDDSYREMVGSLRKKIYSNNPTYLREYGDVKVNAVIANRSDLPKGVFSRESRNILKGVAKVVKPERGQTLKDYLAKVPFLAAEEKFKQAA
jgi:hypothetical protein